MKAAEAIMRTARDEWRRFHPVDRNPGRKVEQRFEALQGRLHDRVKAEWDRNLAAKEALVAEAKSLADADLPMAEKIETAKVLQRRWREVGITPRRPDQRLWRVFRGACDNVFSAREQARQAADSAQEALEARLRDALATYSGILDRAEADPVTAAEAAGAEAADVALRTFREQMAELDHLPAGRRRALADQQKALLGRQAALQQVRRRHRQQALLTGLKSWDEAMTAVETTGAQPPANDPVGADVAAVRESARGAPVPTDALRRLTVKAEIAAGIGSSPGDDAIRLEVQVERLQAGLTGGGDAEDARSLALSWCALGPKDDGVATLRERLFVALAALI
jgi:hypothetical protein